LIRKVEQLEDDEIRVVWQNGDKEVFRERAVIRGLCTEVYDHSRIIPAQPGYELICWDELSDYPEPTCANIQTWRTPVIAWKVGDTSERDNVAIAIDRASDTGCCAIVEPSGRVRVHDSQCFETVAELLEWIIKEKVKSSQRSEAAE
jgi:hypothetical protein